MLLGSPSYPYSRLSLHALLKHNPNQPVALSQSLVLQGIRSRAHRRRVFSSRAQRPMWGESPYQFLLLSSNVTERRLRLQHAIRGWARRHERALSMPFRPTILARLVTPRHPPRVGRRSAPRAAGGARGMCIPDARPCLPRHALSSTSACPTLRPPSRVHWCSTSSRSAPRWPCGTRASKSPPPISWESPTLSGVIRVCPRSSAAQSFFPEGCLEPRPVRRDLHQT